MKRFFVVVPDEGGGVERYPMKAWLRRNPAEVPEAADPDLLTSRQIRQALRKHGWTVEEDEQEVRLMKPGGTDRLHPRAALPVREPLGPRPSPIREREWVRQLVPRLQTALQKGDGSLEVRDGYRLAYSREILSYDGDQARDEAGMSYETDLLVVEWTGSVWTPRVVVEAKLGTVTTHDAITYSQKAATHKHVHPYLRYGIFLGVRKHYPLPGRLFRHGAHFDFMVSWRGLDPTEEELAIFTKLLEDEVAASRLLQEIMFNTRAKDRASYTVLHKPVITRQLSS